LFAFYFCRKDGLFVEMLAFTTADSFFTLLFKEVDIFGNQKQYFGRVKK